MNDSKMGRQVNTHCGLQKFFMEVEMADVDLCK